MHPSLLTALAQKLMACGVSINIAWEAQWSPSLSAEGEAAPVVAQLSVNAGLDFMNSAEVRTFHTKLSNIANSRGRCDAKG